MLFCFSFLTLACFHQSVIGRRLASPFIAKSWTAYSLKECEQFCVSEKGFTCRGFAYREIEQASELQNCDLSQKNTSDLDPYNEQHFLQHPVTDFYEIKALRSTKDNCFDIGQDKIDINDVEILSSSHVTDRDWPQATFLQPQSGEDAVVIIQQAELPTLAPGLIISPIFDFHLYFKLSLFNFLDTTLHLCIPDPFAYSV